MMDRDVALPTSSVSPSGCHLPLVGEGCPLSHAARDSSPEGRAKGGGSKTVEYTMTARIELTLVGLTDSDAMEALVRDYWNGYLKAACDAIDSKVPMDDIKLSEIKIFVRDMEGSHENQT